VKNVKLLQHFLACFNFFTLKAKKWWKHSTFFTEKLEMFNQCFWRVDFTESSCMQKICIQHESTWKSEHIGILVHVYCWGFELTLEPASWPFWGILARFLPKLPICTAHSELKSINPHEIRYKYARLSH
jgi:hypothetical protein